MVTGVTDDAHDAGTVTGLLKRVGDGDASAFDLAFSHVYEDLKRSAHRQLRFDRSGLSTISLVNETYLRVSRDASFRPQDRGHLIGLTSRAMREVLVEHFRSRATVKRGRGHQPVTLSEDLMEAQTDAIDMLSLDRALQQLEVVDARLAKVVEWRYFGGFSEPEIAEALGVTDRTVQRDWRKARAFLQVALSGSGSTSIPDSVDD
jgi:RNA polymerase sigma factor (TIGR02999 family)